MLKISILLSVFLCSVCTSLFGDTTYIASPPKGWERINDPSQLPQKIKVIYIGQSSGSNAFTPSLNVACEETSMPIHEYVLLAKKYHEGQGGTHCTSLGQIKTQSGMAELLQIDRPTQWGDIRFVQAMLMHNGQAFVVTATCLKSEFSNHSAQIFKAIQSLMLPEITVR